VVRIGSRLYLVLDPDLGIIDAIDVYVAATTTRPEDIETFPTS
jgi:hypothetical protein